MLFDKIFRLSVFLITVAVLIGVLKILGWVPEVFQKGFGKEYRTIDEVKSRLKIPKIYAPSYFPQSLRWPPSRIIAQTRPFTAIVMEFRRVEDGAIALVILQRDASHEIKHDKIRMLRVNRQGPHLLEGREALLVVGSCDRGEPCGRVDWTEGNQKVSVIARASSAELLKIAKSVLPHG